MPVFAATIFLSAFLLFLVQPIIAKQILPWFGGTPAVWNTCMVFFQALLLAGYAYSDWTTRRLSPRAQVILHSVLLIASLAVLPIITGSQWKPIGDEDPGLRILALLAATIGLPYFLLSSTSPLVQAWLARRGAGAGVYRLFALSNFGSLVALLAYPFTIEPWITTRLQALGWSTGYAVYAVMCVAAGFFSLKGTGHAAQAGRPVEEHGPAPGWGAHLLWLSLAGLGTVMLLAITNHITQNVASIPLLWIVPLTLYLLTFILCFEGRGWYRRDVFVGPFLIALPAMAWGLSANGGVLHIREAIPLYCVGLFVACMFFHGELARAKPSPRWLTRFYLMLSLGGALGGLFVGMIAPRIFPGYYEFPIGLTAGGLIAAIVLWSRTRLGMGLAVAAAATTFATGHFIEKYIEYLGEDTRLMARNFFGTLRVQEYTSGEKQRRLVHGVIMHGKQMLDAPQSKLPSTYYTAPSGIGRAIEALTRDDRRIGVVGLGTGTLAVYGKPGDVFRFYEINPIVIDVAKREFTYLSDTAAKVETVLGDARLQMERESPQKFDVLAIDAFSSDAIPVHLMTLEAMDVYLRHLAPEGVIVFHTTNRYLNLPPVVKRIAQERGLFTSIVRDDGDAPLGASSDWVLVSRSKAALERAPIKEGSIEVEMANSTPLWTDDFNNLLRVLKKDD